MKNHRILFIALLSLFLTSLAGSNVKAQSPGNGGKEGNAPVIIGSMMKGTLEDFQLFKKLKLGNGILTFLPKDKQGTMAMARFCYENKIYLNFWEVVYRSTHQFGWGWGKRIPRDKFYSKKEFDAIIDAAGPYYFGRYTIGEIGLMLYGPQSYEVEWRGDTWPNLQAVSTMEEAKNAYINYARQWIDYDRTISKGPLVNVEAGMTFKYLAPAGLDKLCLEMMPGDPQLLLASIRGAGKAFGKPWGTHIAMEHYGGVSLDELWQKRWKTAIYYSYISGAQFIWKETSPFFYSERSWEPRRGFNSPEMKQARQTLREAYQFVSIHTRPANGPKVKLGIVYGNNDGSPGLWNRVAWGQYGDEKWLEGPAERGWNLVNKLSRKEEWSSEKVQGEKDFSGNPPYGQYDVVPIEAPLDVLQQYSALVFLGWNNMTEKIYEKLKAYVNNGGHLVMYLQHLNTEPDRGKEVKLFRNGDFTDLFGAKIFGPGKKEIQGIKCMAESSLKSYRFPLWRIRTDPRFLGLFTPARVQLTGGRVISGFSDSYKIQKNQLESRPVLIENTLGKGTAFLVAVYEFPADEGIIRFTRDMLRTVLQGEQADIRLLSNDRIRYAVYEGENAGLKDKYKVIYLLNTDPDVSALVKMWIRGKVTEAFIVPAGELRLAYLCGDLLLIPEQKTVDLANWNHGKKRDSFKFFSATEQKFDVFNMGNQPHEISINGQSLTCHPDGHTVIKVAKTADPSREAFFADDFLTEPEVDIKN